MNIQYKQRKKNRHTIKEYLYIAFVVSCMMPFVLPNPILKTDLQPYAAILATIIVSLDGNVIRSCKKVTHLIYVYTMTFIIAFYVFCFGSVSMTGLRGLFTYYSLFIVPYAVYVSLKKLEWDVQEICKFLILVWFMVSTIQFFFLRSFAMFLVSGSRFGQGYRGVCGLASEPSFFGIACFYFLNIAKRFTKQRNIFYVLITIMGVFYAQSMMGVIFILSFWVIELLDNKDVIGVAVGIVCAWIALVVIWYIISKYMSQTRLFELLNKLHGNSISIVESDASVSSRFSAIVNSLRLALDKAFIPQGFHSRIGSGFGGLLVEIGFFAFPVIFVTSYILSLTPSRRTLRTVYFIVVLLLHFNNTQIANPILMFILGQNLLLEVTSDNVDQN